MASRRALGSMGRAGESGGGRTAPATNSKARAEEQQMQTGAQARRATSWPAGGRSEARGERKRVGERERHRRRTTRHQQGTNRAQQGSNSEDITTLARCRFDVHCVTVVGSPRGDGASRRGTPRGRCFPTLLRPATENKPSSCARRPQTCYVAIGQVTEAAFQGC